MRRTFACAFGDALDNLNLVKKSRDIQFGNMELPHQRVSSQSGTPFNGKAAGGLSPAPNRLRHHTRSNHSHEK
jgi:hypothetical protein